MDVEDNVSDSDFQEEEEEEEESDFLYTNARDNAAEFLSSWNENMANFLKRDEYISIRGTALSEDDVNDLDINADIDGISICWKHIGEGLLLDFTHLNIKPRNDYEIKPFFPIVKKHLNLPEYGSSGLSILRKTLGYQVLYYGGWETWISFIPKSRTAMPEYTSEQLRQLTFACLEKIRKDLQEELKELLHKGIACNTLAKNNLEDVERLFVLPGDQQHILCALQRAVEKLRDASECFDSRFHSLFFTFRFGEKCRTHIDLPIRDANQVLDICVHVGVTLSNLFVDLFWNRDGVKSVVGRKGQLSFVLSLFECVNFQSNLDERRLDISNEVLQVCRFPQNVRFFQMYSDLPHRRPKAIVHPVSACVIFAEGILREQSRKKIIREAAKYLSEIRNNFNQIRQCNCRMEYVIQIPEVPTTVVGSDYILKENIHRLLMNYPMISAIDRHEDDVSSRFRQVGIYLCDQLTNIFRTLVGTGDCDSVWDAYQMECAVEKMLWGAPFCNISHIYSVNLGVGVGHPSRSLSDQKGFLCLEESSACCVDETTTPPLCIFTKSETVQKQIQRTFGVYNLREASHQVIGKQVVLRLLTELFDYGNVYGSFSDFLLNLRRSSEPTSLRILGGITPDDLAKKLANAKKGKWPITFTSFIQLTGLDIPSFSDALKQGILALKIDYFPAVRLTDESRNSGLHWTFKYGVFVLLNNKEQCCNYESEAESVHTLVLCELEKFKICHTSQYQHTIFPWLKPVLEKIAEKKLSKEDKLLTLAFVSGVAMIMNGYYADYLNLSRLERKLPLSQVMLRMLEVLCKSRLGNVNTVSLYKLHPSVPYKLYSKKAACNSSFMNDRKKEMKESERIREDDMLTGMEISDTVHVISDNVDVDVPTRHLSQHQCEGSGRSQWTCVEIKILQELLIEYPRTKKRRPRVQLYRKYQEKCREKSIPDRTYAAFIKKFTRFEKEH